MKCYRSKNNEHPIVVSAIPKRKNKKKGYEITCYNSEKKWLDRDFFKTNFSKVTGDNLKEILR